MWKCPKCKEQCEDNFDSCWSCGTGRDGSVSSEPFPEPEVVSGSRGNPSTDSKHSKGGRRPVMSRYTDAYLIARTLNGFGATVKLIAVILAGAIAVGAVILGNKSPVFAVGGITVGIIVAVPVYILGILVSAQGQILKATLDAAVHTSPLLTKDEMRQIMSLD